MTKPDNLTVLAQAAAITHSIPRDAYQAYREQYNSARRRGIHFLFNLPDWWTWWQIDSRWERRGVGGEKLVMARKGDQGAYSPDNVYCCAHVQNVKDIDPRTGAEKRRARWAAKSPEERAAFHLSVRGDGHPRSRAVFTPMGRFGSAALAAEAHGITRQHASQLAKARRNGWMYADGLA